MEEMTLAILNIGANVHPLQFIKDSARWKVVGNHSSSRTGPVVIDVEWFITSRATAGVFAILTVGNSRCGLEGDSVVC